MSGEKSETRRRMEDFDETLRTSASTSASVDTKSRKDIDTYVEIGRSLQNLRRTVYDMVKEDASHTKTTSHVEIHHHHSHHSRHADTHQNDSTIILTPSSIQDSSHIGSGTMRGNHTPVTDQDYEFQQQQQQYRGDQGRHSKTRISTPYRRIPREYDEYEHIQQIRKEDFDSETNTPTHHEKTERNSSSSKSKGSRSDSSKKSKKSRKNHRDIADIEDKESTAIDSPRNSAQNTGSSSNSSNSSSPSSDDSSIEHMLPSAAAEVSQSIAVIVGQHEEKFVQ